MRTINWVFRRLKSASGSRAFEEMILISVSKSIRRVACSPEKSLFFARLRNSEVLANVEAIIDFSDEDLPSGIIKKIKEQNKNIIKKIETEFSETDFLALLATKVALLAAFLKPCAS